MSVTRARAREIAFQALYQLDLNPGASAEDIDRFIAARLHGGPLVGFAEGIVRGVGETRGEIDALLDGRAERWRVARMAATDRAVLRLAVFELRHSDTPGPVVVDEAIDLARRYGNDASPRFVAGVLGGLLAGRAAADDAAVPSP